MKNRRLFSRRSRSRYVLFSSKGKASANKPAVAVAGQIISAPANQRTSASKKQKKPAAANQIANASTSQYKVLDFAALSSWYAEQNALKEVVNEPNAQYTYTAEKQKNLRFMLL